MSYVGTTNVCIDEGREENAPIGITAKDVGKISEARLKLGLAVEEESNYNDSHIR